MLGRRGRVTSRVIRKREEEKTRREEEDDDGQKRKASALDGVIQSEANIPHPMPPSKERVLPNPWSFNPIHTVHSAHSTRMKGKEKREKKADGTWR